jgi:DNA (cytosine-5)-methyltransferase 1
VVFGEQVASGAAKDWLDLVSTDLEGLGYAFGAAAVPGCSVGSPDIRQRAWFVADSDVQRRQRKRLHVCARQSQQDMFEAARGSQVGQLADADGWDACTERKQRGGEYRLQQKGCRAVRSQCERSRANHLGDLADTSGNGLEGWERVSERSAEVAIGEGVLAGYWADSDWIYCRDEKWRPIKPGTFPLATRVPGGVERLRAYGNAIKPQVGEEVIKAFMRG